MNDKLTEDSPIAALGLSGMTRNCIERNKFRTIGDLTQYSEKNLLDMRNFGPTSLAHVKEKLTAAGFTLSATGTDKWHFLK